MMIFFMSHGIRYQNCPTFVALCLVGCITKTTRMIYKAVFNLALAPPDKAFKMQDIHTKMQAVLLFNDPPISFAIAGATLDNLNLRIAEAEQGGLLAKQLLVDALNETNTLIISYRNYVTLKAKGNKTHVLSSGFNATKEPTPVGNMGQIVNLKAKLTGISGEGKLRWKSIYGRQFYEIQYKSGNDVGWTTISTTNVNFLLTGLTPLSTCKVRVRAKGAAGYGEYSNTIEFTVL